MDPMMLQQKSPNYVEMLLAEESGLIYMKFGS